MEAKTLKQLRTGDVFRFKGHDYFKGTKGIRDLYNMRTVSISLREGETVQVVKNLVDVRRNQMPAKVDSSVSLTHLKRNVE